MPKGLVRNPYPIGFLNKISIPYSIWDKNRHGFYHIPAFALRPYPAFISKYYSVKGWCYQRRRTWHGCITVAESPPISVNPKKPAQVICQTKFAGAVTAWQALSVPQRKIWNVYRFPIHASGYNRFLRAYMKNQI